MKNYLITEDQLSALARLDSYPTRRTLAEDIATHPLIQTYPTLEPDSILALASELHHVNTKLDNLHSLVQTLFKTFTSTLGPEPHHQHCLHTVLSSAAAE